MADMTTDWSRCKAVEKVPGRMGGVLVFKDTRLAVSQLFGVLRDGGTIHDFLEWFDTVVNESDVKAVLDFLEADLTREWAQKWAEGRYKGFVTVETKNN